MSSHPQLFTTEKRLIRLFMIGIFLFLIVFEAIFLVSRNILEERNEYAQFDNESSQMLRMAREDIPQVPGNRTMRRPNNIGFLVLNASGSIVQSRIAGQDVKNVSDILEDTDIENIESGTIVKSNNFLIRKVAIEDGGSILFLRPCTYDSSELLRDIIRFLFMDILILIPFYFMARIYVRETLEPVRENLDTMTHFVHDAGHELKTPLAIVSGNLQFLRDSKKPDITVIHESLEAINGMNDSIQGLLELADLKLADKQTQTELQDLIDREIERLSGNYDTITVQNTISEKTIIHASEKHLSILIRNLLENAMKYNRENGSVMISFDKGILTISDTGIGIAADEKDRIFDRFYRANAGSGKNGSGIGLTLVDRIAKLYGWRISVESELGKGTKIEVKM